MCLYLNWLNIFVSCVQQRVYRSRVQDVTELKQRLLDVWHGMEQGVIDSAIDEWRRRIRAYVWAKWDISSKRCENINNLLNSNVSTCISLKLCKICVILKSWMCGSCGFFFRRVEVNMLCDFCFTFNSLSSSERILKIGRDLTKLLPNFGSTLFLRHSV